MLQEEKLYTKYTKMKDIAVSHGLSNIVVLLIIED